MPIHDYETITVKNPAIGRTKLGVAAASHTHTISDITGLQGTIDGITTTYMVVDASDYAKTVQLPAGTGSGPYSIKKSDSSSNAVTITPDGTETIDGDVSLILTIQNQAATLVFADGGWHIV